MSVFYNCLCFYFYYISAFTSLLYVNKYFRMARHRLGGMAWMGMSNPKRADILELQIWNGVLSFPEGDLRLGYYVSI